MGKNGPRENLIEQILDRSSKTTHFVGVSQNLDFLKVEKSCRF